MISRARSDRKPWLLGSLPEGWEWFAFTFSDQDQIQLSSDEVTNMLEASDQITRRAYARMTLDHEHRWARHTPKEAAEIIEYCHIEPGQAVLDFGCGAGRHAIALARTGIRVTGVDYAPELVEKAGSKAKRQGVSGTRFLTADCRGVRLDELFDAAVCLYDVVGTYADLKSNSRVVANLADHLKPGGFALISVMNLVLTKNRARHVFSMAEEPDKLLQLPPSNTMETTGDIFDPDYFMLDQDSAMVYRKEQFTRGSDLPTEVIVRDRRFSPDEIASLCSGAGLQVVWTRPVQAGHWDRPLDEHDARAKEILVLCRKPA
jgi:2-polyprenyl-3-methyl-5-hydroxy-6-metoxy-1,4-benzoquinol methylase